MAALVVRELGASAPALTLTLHIIGSGLVRACVGAGAAAVGRGTGPEVGNRTSRFPRVAG